MTLIIDGYNLLYASGILGKQARAPSGLERARQALLNFLVETLPPDELARTTVVFDASEAPYGVARQTKHKGLNVHFASKHEDADTLIEELIQQDSAPKRLTVVSSDHRLHRAAKRRKATPTDSDRWFHEMLRQRADGAAVKMQPSKPEGPFSEAEVQFWLEKFGEGK